MTNSAGDECDPKEKTHVGVTPLPKLKMLAVAATLLTEAICTTMLFPFVGLYVAYLQGISVEDAGYSSGILVGLFMLGQVISCKGWGWLSDTYGRKGPLCAGLFTAAWAMLFFGMAPNIYICCLMRFIHGILNGNVLIAKIIISDITDETNAPLGFSMIGLLWSIGCVIGPAVGGFLYDPLMNPKLHWLHVREGGFLARNPAFLPSFFVFVYTIGTCLLVGVVVPETNTQRTKSIRDIPVVGWVIRIIRPKPMGIIEVVDTSNILEECEEGSPAPRSRAVPTPSSGKVVTMTYVKFLKDSILFTMLVIAMCISATDMAFGEVMPLWAIAPRAVGGLEMFSDTVGILMLSFAVPTFIMNLSFPRIYKKVNNAYYMWRGGITIFGLSIVLVPFACNLDDKAAFWYVLVMGSIKQGVGSGCFTLINLLTAKAAPPGTVGSVYGISQSITAAVRCVVPFVVAPLFAWSLSGHHSFPFNHYFVFFLSIVPLIYSVYLTFTRMIIRPEEDLEQWEADGLDVVVMGQSSMEDYRSLANSFSMHQGDNVLSLVPEIVGSQARRALVHEWIQRTAPRGRGTAMESAVKALRHEDCRVISSEEPSELEKEEEET